MRSKENLKWLQQQLGSFKIFWVYMYMSEHVASLPGLPLFVTKVGWALGYKVRLAVPVYTRCMN